MKRLSAAVLLGLATIQLSACSSYSSSQSMYQPAAPKMAAAKPLPDYSSRLPSHSPTGSKLLLIDPNVHAWGAYGSNGELLRAGLATAGGDWCPDIGRRCHTRSGTFSINSLGNAGCKSTIYPLPRGGAPMPYCMFFNGNQAIHGSYEVVEGNVSHGCVRVRVGDADWIRHDFANVGTQVIVRPY